MKKYQSILVDDEVKLREVLKLKLAKHCPEIEVIAEAGDAESAYRMIMDCKPEIVFLDIAMPKGSGFDLLARFHAIDFQVIFVTGFNEYALKALRLSAVDYLLKPVIDEELIAAVAKAALRVDSNLRLAELEILQHNVSSEASQKSKVSIPSGNSYDQVQIADLLRLEGEQRYTRVYLSNGREILSSYSIGRFKELLADYAFIDCHKSHFVNSAHISKYNSEGVIVMDDNSVIPVSRRKREEVKHQVLLLLAEKK